MKNKSLLYHFDFYRIKTIDELVEIGFDDYVYSNKICFIVSAVLTGIVLFSTTIVL